MKRAALLLFILSFKTIAAPGDSLITISEIMFYPQSGENEFIELFNLSYADTIDLTGYKFKYYTSAADPITDCGFGLKLPPRCYAVVFEGDYDILTGIYKNIVPPEALILKISDNAFGATGMANTSDRPVYLLNPSGDTVEAVTYAASGQQTGFSDEKILLSKDNSSANWGNTIIYNGTPGKRNSIAPFEYDVSLERFSMLPALIFEGNLITIHAAVKNLGLNEIAGINVKIYLDADKDSVGTPDEIIYENSISSLAAGEEFVATIYIDSLDAGLYVFIAETNAPLDENPENDKRYCSLRVHKIQFKYNDVAINEIMYAPLSGEPEWVEIFNNSDSVINLKKWRFADNSTSVAISAQDIFIAPEEYAILAKDTTIKNFFSVKSKIVIVNLPALNNTGDACVIKDSLGVLIDSLYYLPSWGGSSGGRSLERVFSRQSGVEPENWGTSINANRGTPGSLNSITPKDDDVAVTYFSGAAAYGIVGENFTLVCRIKNLGIKTQNNLELKLYCDADCNMIGEAGEELETQIVSALFPNEEMEFIFNYFGINVGANCFIAKLILNGDQAPDNNEKYLSVNGAAVNELFGDIVINEIMYYPNSPEPEWVEIYNRSGKTINLNGYRIADNSSSARVVFSRTELNPGEYFVIAKDGAIFNKYAIPSKYIISSFPALNNDVDKVILRDSLARAIDSLEYRSSWGGTGGRSLERVDFDASSVDQNNWKSSKAFLGATPGYINSVSIKDYDLQLMRITFAPQNPMLGGNAEIFAVIKNIGKNESSFSLYLYEDLNGDDLPDALIETVSQLSLFPGDSMAHKFNYEITALTGARTFIAAIDWALDQDTLNNKVIGRIAVGVPEGAVLINEVMYYPANGEPEWIEFYNAVGDSINIKNWKVKDILTTPVTATITAGDFYIAPRSYFIVSSDSLIWSFHSSIPSKIIYKKLPVLNNDYDGVILIDDAGRTIDSLRYSKNWGGKIGHSLERKLFEKNTNDSTNWAPSADIEQSTPGRENSIKPKLNDCALISIGFVPQYPVVNEEFMVSAHIKNIGLNDAANIELNFYFNGELKTGMNGISLIAGEEKQITAEERFRFEASVLNVKVELIFQDDENPANNAAETTLNFSRPEKSIVINEIMYNPSDGAPEWFELFNASSDEINLKNWTISDVISPAQKTISVDDLFLQPERYLTLAADTNIFSFFNCERKEVLIVKIGALGNAGDGVVVKDLNGKTIDSVFYFPNWGGEKGYSLERIAVEKNSLDSSNWKSSLAGGGATPGKENSVKKLVQYQKNSLVINEVMFDPAAGNNEFVEFYNLSGDTVNIGGWTIEDESRNVYRLGKTFQYLPPAKYFLFAADSSILLNYNVNREGALITVNNSASLGLNNSGELILLKDGLGNTVDSVFYSAKWHNGKILNLKNKSLEKINPRFPSNDFKNWSTCVEILGATPGSCNSVYTEKLSTDSKIDVRPNPFSPDNDGFEDFTIISYNLTQYISQIRIKIFDSRGRFVRSLVNNQASGSNGAIIFDGKDEDGNPLKIGIYIIYIEALNDLNGVVEVLKTPVVVARKL